MARLNEAIRNCEEQLARDPRDAQAWHNLGAYLKSAGRLAAAESCYRRALALRPDHALTLTNLGNLLKELERHDDALHYQRRAVEQAPEHHLIRQNLGIALRQAGRREEALDAFQRAVELAPSDAACRWDLALEYLAHGRLADGWPLYEARWALRNNAAEPHDTPRWRGEAFRGKRLLIQVEQGFGDTLWAARFLAAVKGLGGEVIVECRAQLKRLLAAVEGIDELRTREERRDDHDLHCPMMSLPGLLGVSEPRAYPPAVLPVPTASRERLRERFPSPPGSPGERFRIGIIWSGSTTFADNRRRACPLEHFLRLAAHPEVALYSLQMGTPRRDLLNRGSGALVEDLTPLTEDFTDTAAAIEQLDLVIMTDSAVAHLTASLGRPVWNLLAFSSYWLYGLEGEECAWYPTMRLWRQRRPGDWEELFRRVDEGLQALLQSRS